MSAQTKLYPDDFQQQVVTEVKRNNRLISDVAKQYCLSAKTVYQWVKSREPSKPSMINIEQLSIKKSNKSELKDALISEITHLQLKLSKLNKKLHSIDHH